MRNNNNNNNNNIKLVKQHRMIAFSNSLTLGFVDNCTWATATRFVTCDKHYTSVSSQQKSLFIVYVILIKKQKRKNLP